MKHGKFAIAVFALLGILFSCTPITTSSTTAPSSEETVISQDSNETSHESTSTASSASTSSSQASSSESTSWVKPEADSRWPVNFDQYGAAFRATLAACIKSTGSKTISYKQNNTVLASSDAATNGSGVRPFYHAPDYAGTNSWNKEHVWPNSRGAGESGPGSDPQMLRPTLTSENSDRGNKYFGTGSNEWDPAKLGYEGARGEAARIIFYTATRYYNTCGSGGSSSGSSPLVLNNDPSSSTGLHSMGSLKSLLEWNRKYPVNSAEIKRNNYLDNQGFARNPFIDHPEYADYIWDSNGLLTSHPYSGQSSSMQPTDYKYHYQQATSVEAISGKQAFILSKESGSYYAMGTDPKASNLPWYITPVAISEIPTDGVLHTDINSFAKFTIASTTSGYTLKAGGQYLYSYVDGSHYSIQYGNPSKDNQSMYWDISFNSSGEVTLKSSATNVYLEYYNGSYCGYSKAGSNPLYIYLV